MSRQLQVKRALQRDVLILGSALISVILSISFVIFCVLLRDRLTNQNDESATYFTLMCLVFLTAVFSSAHGYLFSYIGMVGWPYDDNHFAGIKREHRFRVILRAQLSLMVGTLLYMLLPQGHQFFESVVNGNISIATVLVYIILPTSIFFILGRFKYFNPKYVK